MSNIAQCPEQQLCLGEARGKARGKAKPSVAFHMGYFAEQVQRDVKEYSSHESWQSGLHNHCSAEASK